MIVRLPDSELGRVKRRAQVPVPWVELVRERGILGVPRPSVLALVRVQVLAVFVLLVPEVLLPMQNLAR